MKKQYIAPNMLVAIIRPSGMMCTSPLGVDPNQTGDQGGAESRGFDDWDWDE